MAKAKDLVRTALDESRILILGAQILLGFQYRAAFESAFDALPLVSQQLTVVGLSLLLVTITLLMLPVSYNHLVGHGEAPIELSSIASKVTAWALLPFATSMGLGLFIVTDRMGRVLAIFFGATFTLLALFFWYGLGMIVKWRRSSRPAQQTPMKKRREEETTTELSVKIDQAMTEARMVLPGAQALLGFQTVSMISQEFQNLPASWQYVHLASLVMTAIATIFLMTPAAYDRIVEQGEQTETLLRIASFFVVASMIPLGAGISGDLLVVVAKVTGSTIVGIVTGILALLFINGLWFGYTLYRRHRNQRRVRTQPAIEGGFFNRSQ